MRTIRILLGALVFAAPYILGAQPNWQTAQLSTTDGEELTGYVEDRRWRYRLDPVRFRKSPNSAVQKFPLSALTRFRSGNRRYLVREVAINYSPRDPRELVREEQAVRKKVRAALRILVEGRASLYEYTDDRSNHHYFLSTDGGPLVYLEFARYALETRGGKTRYREANTYRGSLLRLLAACPRMRPEILRTPYRREALVRLIGNYHDCRGAAPDYLPEREGSSWTFGPDFGIIRSNPTYGDIEDPVFPFSGLSSREAAFGGHLKYRFGGPRGAVALRFGVLYHEFDVDDEVPDPEEEDPAAGSVFRYNYTERGLHFQFGPEVVLVRSRYPIFFESVAEYHRILSYSENRFNRRLVGGQEVLDGRFYNFPDTGALSLSAGFGIMVGKARLSLRASASRRSYPTYVLNLYRVGVMGSVDF